MQANTARSLQLKCSQIQNWLTLPGVGLCGPQSARQNIFANNGEFSQTNMLAIQVDSSADCSVPSPTPDVSRVISPPPLVLPPHPSYILLCNIPSPILTSFYPFHRLSSVLQCTPPPIVPLCYHSLSLLYPPQSVIFPPSPP